MKLEKNTVLLAVLALMIVSAPSAMADEHQNISQNDSVNDTQFENDSFEMLPSINSLDKAKDRIVMLRDKVEELEKKVVELERTNSSAADNLRPQDSYNISGGERNVFQQEVNKSAANHTSSEDDQALNRNQSSEYLNESSDEVNETLDEENESLENSENKSGDAGFESDFDDSEGRSNPIEDTSTDQKSANKFIPDFLNGIFS